MFSNVHTDAVLGNRYRYRVPGNFHDSLPVCILVVQVSVFFSFNVGLKADPDPKHSPCRKLPFFIFINVTHVIVSTVH
jgi:hypothetical protein